MPGWGAALIGRTNPNYPLPQGVEIATRGHKGSEAKKKVAHRLRNTAIDTPGLDSGAQRRDIGGHAHQRGKAYGATSDLEVPGPWVTHRLAAFRSSTPRAIKLDGLLGNFPECDGAANVADAYRW